MRKLHHKAAADKDRMSLPGPCEVGRGKSNVSKKRLSQAFRNVELSAALVVERATSLRFLAKAWPVALGKRAANSN
jgi:hypothetical protein